MRQVSKTVISAFISGNRCTKQNTSTDGQRLYLHGNLIAEKTDNGGYMVSLAGWPTPTTKERLNSLCVLLGLPHMFHQSKHLQYFGKEEISADDWCELPSREQAWKQHTGWSEEKVEAYLRERDGRKERISQ